MQTQQLDTEINPTHILMALIMAGVFVSMMILVPMWLTANYPVNFWRLSEARGFTAGVSIATGLATYFPLKWILRPL